MMTKREQTNSPHNICIWRPISNCKDCLLNGHLNYHFKLENLTPFYGFIFTLCNSSFYRDDISQLWLVSYRVG